MAITNNGIMALSLLWLVVSPLLMFKPPNNPLTFMQQRLSNRIIPIKFKKQEKEDERSKD